MQAMLTTPHKQLQLTPTVAAAGAAGAAPNMAAERPLMRWMPAVKRTTTAMTAQASTSNVAVISKWCAA
jgi:hypothetical protein